MGPEPGVSRELTRYLTRGVIQPDRAEALAAEIDRHILAEVQRDLPSALRFARRLVRNVSDTGPVALSSHRALARAALMSGSYTEAEQAYLSARKLPGCDALARGRIDRTLIDVYMYLGDFKESRRRASLALRTFRRLDLPDEIAKTEVNYANLLHRQDRHREAEKKYADAAAYFAGAGNDLAAARCYFNQANTLVQLFRFDEAEALYAKADSTYRRHGHELDAVDARWGISWLHMLEGKFHVALRELHECEAAYRRIGSPLRVASCELDRAEVYLNLNLFEDARRCAIEAEKQFGRLKIRYEKSKASLYRAFAAFALHRESEGRAVLKRARDGFRRDQNDGFLGAAQLLDARVRARPRERQDRLQEAKRSFSRAQLPLWQAVCDLHLASLPQTDRSALSRLEKNRAARNVPHFFARWQTLLGDLRAREGATSKAIAHWQQAADRLDAVRAQLPPLELRGAFGKELSSPHARLIAAELDRDPLTAAIWSERAKTAGLWAPLKPTFADNPARQRVEESLMSLAGQVASVFRQLGHTGERSLSAAGYTETITELERRVRDELTLLDQAPADDRTAPKNLEHLYREYSSHLPIVQFHLSDSEIIAFVHHRGATRWHRFPYGRERIERLVAQWRFMLESAVLADLFSEPYDVAEERALFEKIGAWLWAPLEIGREEKQVLLLPEGELFNLPWQAVRYDGDDLIDRHAFLYSPSLRHFVQAKQTRVRSKRIRIFLGHADDLPHLKTEAQALSDLAGDGADIHDPSRRIDWPTDETARLWHYAGHAQLNRENPFYSSLALSDGPLFAADFRLRNNKVWLATIAACQSGAQPSLPGEEATGLVRSLLEMGARNVVAGHWPVADRSTAQWMGAFYQEVFGGEKLPGAVQRASRQVREQFGSAYHWAAFALFGAGS